MEWNPTISDRSGPLYLRIVEALAADIARGRLRRGQVLPTHRMLAKALGVDLTTVTRAYGKARERGLTEARVGRGTFVAESAGEIRLPPLAQADIDLSMNLPPQPAEADLEGRIARGIAALSREVGLARYLTYRPSGGSEEERSVAAEWMRTRLPGISTERLMISGGTQAALAALLGTLAKPGDIVLTEALTYPGMRSAASLFGVALVGVAMDKEGVMPDALAAACRRHKPRLVDLTPAIHNPTTASMTPTRRRQVAAVIAKANVLLIEDDAYGRLDKETATLAALIPERTYLAASLSKCVAPGLRVSFVAAPDGAAANRLAAALNAAMQMATPLTAALATRFIKDGTLDAVIGAIRSEAAFRQKLAAKALSGYAYAAHRCGHHIWLPLPMGWRRAEFSEHVRRQGLAVVTSDAFSVGSQTPHAIRVSLGAAPSRAELARGLDVLAAALRHAPVAQQIV
ncbi:MAG TPA: PLP-dependent aminotransferase family protein [Xanthobacteraceae bacterium]|nr:PLP-dependent aminotransferase family protein [Xanthobacteraceae bacterium]